MRGRSGGRPPDVDATSAATDRRSDRRVPDERACCGEDVTPGGDARHKYIDGCVLFPGDLAYGEGFTVDFNGCVPSSCDWVLGEAYIVSLVLAACL